MSLDTSIGCSANASTLDQIQTLFGEIYEENVAFVIDSSGSMHKSLPVIKKHLIETLMKMAQNKDKAHKFNLIHFNKEVFQWSDMLIECTVPTVTVATRWIRNIEINVGSELSKALATAFDIAEVNAVYLVADGYSSEDRTKIINNARVLSVGRPIHTFYIAHSMPPDPEALRFLSSLSAETYGTLNIIEHSIHGPVERITPIFRGSKDSPGFPTFMSPAFSTTVTNPVMHNNASGRPSTYSSMKEHKLDLNKNPLSEPLLSAAMIATDHRSIKPVESPFYHPYYHNFWPHGKNAQQANRNAGGERNWMTGQVSQGHTSAGAGAGSEAMWSHYRASRAFIDGKSELHEAHDNPMLVPTAAALLIGRVVLVRDQDSPSLFHKATVKSQTGPYRFLLVLQPKCTSTDEDSYRAVQAMDATVGDFIDFDNALGADINEGDGVVVPCSSNTSNENFQNATSFVLAQVVAGRELRCVSPLYEPQHQRGLKVKLLANQEVREVGPMKALKVPPQIFARLSKLLPSASKSKQSPSKGNNSMSHSTHHSPTHQVSNNNNCSPPMMAPMSDLERYIVGAPGGGIETSANPVKSQYGAEMSSWNHGGHCLPYGAMLPYGQMPVYPNGGLCYVPGSVSHQREDIEEKARRMRQKSDQERALEEAEYAKRVEMNRAATMVDPNYERWLQMQEEKHSISSASEDSDDDDDGHKYSRHYRERPSSRLSSKSKSSSTGDLRPPWRYWGVKGIPNIMDPPSFEPYEPSSDWGRLPERPQVHYTQLGPLNEWSSPNFNVVNPQKLTQVNPYQMFEVMQHKPHQPSAPPKRHVAVGGDACMWTPQEMRQHQEEKRWHRHIASGGYPSVSRLPASLGGDSIRQSMPNLASSQQHVATSFTSQPQFSNLGPKMSRVDMQRALDNHNREVFKRSKEDLARSDKAKVNFALPPTGKSGAFSRSITSSEYRQQAVNEMRFTGESGWMDSAAAKREHSQMSRQKTPLY